MIKKLNFSFYFKSKNLLFLNNKFFSKYIYTKFLISKIIQISIKKQIYFLDNFFLETNFISKNKFKKLKFFKIKTKGFSFKANLFFYKHSKLKNLYFFTSFLKGTVKKSLIFSINSLKSMLSYPKLNFGFFYKTCRGGFIGFINQIIGFLPSFTIIEKKQPIQKYKNYFLISNILLLTIKTRQQLFPFFLKNNFNKESKLKLSYLSKKYIFTFFYIYRFLFYLMYRKGRLLEYFYICHNSLFFSSFFAQLFNIVKMKN